jgi:hypothetical protein
MAAGQIDAPAGAAGKLVTRRDALNGGQHGGRRADRQATRPWSGRFGAAGLLSHVGDELSCVLENERLKFNICFREIYFASRAPQC